MWQPLVEFIRDQYRCNKQIPLHAPIFGGNEQAYVAEAITSTYVSSVGGYVNRLERAIAEFTGSPDAVATVNGTAALHIALKLAGVGAGDLVLTQSVTFVATCNAIAYCGAEPVFIDVDRRTLGLSVNALSSWLSEHAEVAEDGVCRFRRDGRAIRACLPMHTFGHPADIGGLSTLCLEWSLALVEDAAESLGSLYRNQHTGTFGKVGVFSFNGNKIITTGGGGMLIGDEGTMQKARFLTTTAKTPHAYEYVHEEIGFNYRLPNLNAALGVAQMEQLETFIEAKRALADRYRFFFATHALGEFLVEPEHCRSNYWLNALICEGPGHRDELLHFTNAQGIGTRPIWRCMHHLPAFRHCLRGDLEVAEWLEQRIVNLPSSVPPIP